MTWEKAKIAKLKAQSMAMFSDCIINIDGDANCYRLVIFLPKGAKFPFKLPTLIGGISVIYMEQEEGN